MRSIVARLLYYISLSGLYVVTLLLVLEIAARMHSVYVEKNNLLIGAFRNGETPVFDKGSLVLVEAETFYPERLGGWQRPSAFYDDDPTLQRILECGPRELKVSAEEHAIRQSIFPELSETAREAYARINGEMVFEIDRQFQAKNTYGYGRFSLHDSDCVERYILTRTGVSPLLRTAIEDAQKTGMRRVVHVPSVNVDQHNGQFSFSCLPTLPDNDADVVAYVFLDVHPEVLVRDKKDEREPENSPWEVDSYRFKPNFQDGTDNSFRTNAFGFRAEDVAVPKPPGIFRILCIGGSTTVEGDTNKTTYPAQLQDKLRDSFPDQDIEVINAGTNGISSSGHLLRLPDYLALEPDIVVLHVGFNDLYLSYVYESRRSILLLSRFVQMAVPSLFAVSPTAFTDIHSSVMGFNLELLTALFQRRGIAVAFASIANPSPETLSKQEYQYFLYQLHKAWHLPMFSFSRYIEFLEYSNGLLREFSRTYGCLYIPVAEQFNGCGTAFVDICHMTQAGIAKKAHVVYTALFPILEDYGSLSPASSYEQNDS